MLGAPRRARPGRGPGRAGVDRSRAARGVDFPLRCPNQEVVDSAPEGSIRFSGRKLQPAGSGLGGLVVTGFA